MTTVLQRVIIAIVAFVVGDVSAFIADTYHGINGANQIDSRSDNNDNNDYPQPQDYLNLSSPWVLAIGSLLAVVLTFNIIMMCYMNCNKNARTGYNSVKLVDSEDFDESEANAINVVSE
eukprot:470774_1